MRWTEAAQKTLAYQMKRSQFRRILSARRGALASHPQLGNGSRQGLRPKRTAVVTHYTQPPDGSTTICTDELGPVIPRTFAPAPGWSPNGHRIKAELDYGRGPEKTWVYGALRVRDGKELTRCAASRNSKGYIALLADIEADNPKGDLFIISDNLSSHSSAGDPYLARGASAHPSRLHSDGSVLAQFAGGLVAPFPA